MNGIGNGARHIGLRLSRPKSFDSFGKRTRSRKQIINLGIVNASCLFGSGMWGEISQTKSGSLSDAPYIGPAKKPD
jgi:hypothetical protein